MSRSTPQNPHSLPIAPSPQVPIKPGQRNSRTGKAKLPRRIAQCSKTAASSSPDWPGLDPFCAGEIHCTHTTFLLSRVRCRVCDVTVGERALNSDRCLGIVDEEGILAALAMASRVISFRWLGWSEIDWTGEAFDEARQMLITEGLRATAAPISTMVSLHEPRDKTSKTKCRSLSVRHFDMTTCILGKQIAPLKSYLST